jgi:hypothetical protein
MVSLSQTRTPNQTRCMSSIKATCSQMVKLWRQPLTSARPNPYPRLQLLPQNSTSFSSPLNTNCSSSTCSTLTVQATTTSLTNFAILCTSMGKLNFRRSSTCRPRFTRGNVEESREEFTLSDAGDSGVVCVGVGGVALRVKVGGLGIR